MTGTLFRLFKGVKYNVLRKRVVSSDFQIQELYLGVLMITLIIFQTPTIALYYYFCFIFIIVSILLDQILLLNLQTVCTGFPTYLLCHVLARPRALPNGLTVSLNGEALELNPNSANLGSVFAHIGAEFKSIIREASPGKIIGMILRGDNLFHVMRDLLNITQKKQRESPEDQKPAEAYSSTRGFRANVRYLARLTRMALRF